MLPEPALDTYEQMSLTRGRECAVLDKPGTLLNGPPGTDWLVITMLHRQPGQKSPLGTVEQSTWLFENCAQGTSH